MRAPYSLTPQQLATLPSAQRVNLEALIDRLEDYISKMAAGKPIDPRDGAAYQQAMWTAVRSVFMAPVAEFSLLYSELLMTVHKNSGERQVFNGQYLFRFFTHMRWQQGSARQFESVMNLLTVTANPATRRLAMQQLDLPSQLRAFNSEAIVEKVMGYYHTL